VTWTKNEIWRIKRTGSPKKKAAGGLQGSWGGVQLKRISKSANASGSKGNQMPEQIGEQMPPKARSIRSQNRATRGGNGTKTGAICLWSRICWSRLEKRPESAICIDRRDGVLGIKTELETILTL
jgi:hypothetical protein